MQSTHPTSNLLMSANRFEPHRVPEPTVQCSASEFHRVLPTALLFFRLGSNVFDRDDDGAGTLSPLPCDNRRLQKLVHFRSSQDNSKLTESLLFMHGRILSDRIFWSSSYFFPPATKLAAREHRLIWWAFPRYGAWFLGAGMSAATNHQK